MGLPLFQVDAFADRPFAGNPAAVCLLDGPREDAWLAATAREMNLSETAFVLADADGFRLRWFTPAVEVDLCGHATLAAAHVLWEAKVVPAAEPIRFATRSGALVARRRDSEVELDFPALAPAPAAAPEGLAETLGAEPLEVATSRFDLLALLADEDAVRGLTVDPARVRRLPARGLIVTAAARAPGFDFVSRFFAPAVGVDEDPVTGSAHCVLAPYWAARLGRPELVGFQASARGGRVRVRLDGDRVRLAGAAVTVLRGELLA